jgi:hypothetical protein
MAKKQFTNSFQDIFTPTESNPNKKVVVKAEDKYEEEVKRTTLLLNRKTYKTIKAVAYWERKQIKDIIQEAITVYLDSMDSFELDKAITNYDANFEVPLPQEHS